jgi:hypothetical protein
MPDYIRGLDHVLIAARDLDAAAAQWRRLGFVPTPPGRHVGRSTGNYCIMFPHDYVELIGIVDEAAEPAAFDGYIRSRGNGLFASAISPTNAEDAHAGVTASGIEAQPLRPLHRTVERPDGPADLYFTNFDMPPQATPDFRFFFCHHLTHDAMRHADWLAHPNGATGLIGIAVVCPEPASLKDPYGKLFGPSNLTMTDDILSVHVNNHHVMYVNDETFQNLHPDFELPPAPAPAYGAAVSFRVSDVEQTANHFDRSGISYQPVGETLQVPPEDGTGVLMEFRA